MVTIEENSVAMLRKHNEELIKKIVSEKFILKNYRGTWDNESWKMDIYSKKGFWSKKYLGWIYPSEHRVFKYVVIGGDPDIFKETAEELEANGIEVTIQKPIK